MTYSSLRADESSHTDPGFAEIGLTDTHCHLDFQLFDEDREEVLARAVKAGINFILNPGIDLASSRAAVVLAEAYPQVYAAVGVHPNDSLTWDTGTLDELRELISHPKVVAVGEIGLDYYRDRAPRDLQQRVFRQQLTLAGESGLPVVIHNRSATSDILGMLSEWHAELQKAGSPLAERPGVLHSFAEDSEAARLALDLKFCIGITGPVTFRNAPKLRQTVASLPLDRVLIETDSPFLTPHPHRGERNEPAYVRFVAEKIAELHEQSPEAVAVVTGANADRLFRWRENS
jgi:TatD DNase family protein